MAFLAQDTSGDKVITKTTPRSASMDFRYGLRKGIPIALGYVPVAFTFGLLAASGGISPWMATVISLTNLTSAGQFAGTNLIIAGAPLLEIAVTTFVINIRYLLMSLSLSQKLTSGTSLIKRAIMAFGITDETFAVASLEQGDISFSYMLGLVSSPYWGWAAGTFVGALICSVLPPAVQSSMGIALYAMFIALIVPSAKRSKPVLATTVIAVVVSCLFTWAPHLRDISAGWGITIAAITASAVGALVFPREEVQDE
jgi:4-azaleucine resistance transporter AzlC